MLKDLLNNKKILFIPIYSMRNYETGKYNLTADGNMARIVSKLFEINFVKAKILYPGYSINLDDAIRPLKHIKNIEWISCSAYGHNAKETRDNYKSMVEFINENKLLDDIDYVVCEPNYLMKYFIESNIYNCKFIYWCVASITSEMCPWFVEEYIDLDKKIAKEIPTAVCTKTQVEALGINSFVEPIYNPEFFDYDIIFFPFRLSDQSYKFEEFRNIIETYYEEIISKCCNRFKVLYSDPNQSYKDKLNNEIFVKVPSDKPVYLSILKSKPIIPYFEDSKNMEHISINEFLYYGCRIIAFENERFDNNINVRQISKLDEIKKVLSDLLK